MILVFLRFSDFVLFLVFSKKFFSFFLDFIIIKIRRLERTKPTSLLKISNTDIKISRGGDKTPLIFQKYSVRIKTLSVDFKYCHIKGL